jgi:hypothetical protein
MHLFIDSSNDFNNISDCLIESYALSMKFIYLFNSRANFINVIFL